MENEIWKPVVGYEGYYEVSNIGRVRSVERIITQKSGLRLKLHGKILSPAKNKSGYYSVQLKRNGNSKRMYVSRLVATMFIQNAENKKEVNHIDGDKSNNKVSNLEWVTPSENQKHAYRTGLKRSPITTETINKAIASTSKPVEMILDDGSTVVFPSTVSAARFLGNRNFNNSIRHCIEKQKSYKGYRFRYCNNWG